MVIAISVGMGSLTLMSVGLGANNHQRATDAMATGYISLLVISLFMTIVLLFFSEDLVRFFGANERLFPHALGYIRGLTFIIPLTLTFYSDEVLKALGHPKFSMCIMSFAVLLNIVLSWYMVSVLGWGTMGSSVATGISFTAALLIALALILNPKQKLHLFKGRFSWELLAKAVYNGSSEGVSELASAVSIFVINLTIVHLLGAEGVAAFTVINYLNFIGILLFLGISNGLVPVLSYNYGAKNFQRVKRIFSTTLRVILLIGLCIFCLLQLYGVRIMELFFKDTNSSEVLAIAAEGLSVYAFIFLLSGFNILTTSFFTSLEHAHDSIIVAALRGFVFIVLGVKILSYIFGIAGVWIAIPFAELLTFLVALYLLRRVYKTLV
ncbi:Na+-driven multidrug efflux pump [Capnocytophaga haemolytica]|uniref:Multidrug export protein mepA n=1 Tax=Capnocytophaga haemolytica TaxID=45243 RepID=A0AAX2GXQ6_9FLAO|nr:MATE family efflux transporter [Capnocytophaga haemolytica]SFN97898.1 Na+-driven multidrug efflux pump [Capnocytophaga haemolytica]SNV09714.1 Multidrug export protein mepA [Capnocytophaga haemolytica]